MSFVDKSVYYFHIRDMKRIKKLFSISLPPLLMAFFLFSPLAKGYSYSRSSLFIDFSRVNSRQTGWQDNWAAGFGAVFPLSQHFAFFLNFSRWGFQISAQDPRLITGRLTLSPLTTGFYFLLLPRYFVSPVISLGGGYIFSQYRFDQRDLITIPEIIKFSKKIKGNFAWEAGPGLLFHLSPRAKVWILFERFQTSLKIETTLVDLNLGTIKRSEAFRFTPYLYRLGFQVSF